jgi:hypothetical protein
VREHSLDKDPTFVLLARIVNGADTDNSLRNQSESAGLNAGAEGFRQFGFKNDLEIIAAESIIYDALYASCQEMVRCGRHVPAGVGIGNCWPVIPGTLGRGKASETWRNR